MNIMTSDQRVYRAELLLEKGYDVHGIIRRSSSFNTNRLNDLYVDLHERTSFSNVPTTLC